MNQVMIMITQHWGFTKMSWIKGYCISGSHSLRVSLILYWGSCLGIHLMSLSLRNSCPPGFLSEILLPAVYTGLSRCVSFKGIDSSKRVSQKRISLTLGGGFVICFFDFSTLRVGVSLGIIDIISVGASICATTASKSTLRTAVWDPTNSLMKICGTVILSENTSREL